MFVCMCIAVTEREIRECIHAGARTVEEVSDCSMAGTGCGGCRETIAMLLENEGGLAGALDGLPRSA